MSYRELINYLGYENFYAGRCISPMLIERCEPVLEERYFSHKFLVKDSFRNNNVNTVYIKNNGSKIYSHTCDCARFKKDKMCSHVSACLIHYIDEITEYEIINELEASNDILSKYETNKNNIKEKLDIDVEFDFYEASVYVRLYVGNTKKYVLSSESKLVDFIRSFKDNEPFTFGKFLTYEPDKHYFSIEDRKIIDFMSQYKNASIGYYHENILGITYREFEYLLKLLNGKKFKIKNHGIVNEVLYKMPTEYVLNLNDDNYLLEISDFSNYVFLDEYFKYVYYHENLYILDDFQIDFIKTLQDSKIKRLKFSKDNLNKFSKGLFSNIKNDLKISDEITEISLPTKPSIKLYFDIRYSDLICDIVFNYNGVDVKYFDNVNVLRDNDTETEIVEEINSYGFNIVDNKFVINDMDLMYDFIDNNLQELSNKYEVFTSKKIENTNILKKLSTVNNFSIGKDNILSYNFSVDNVDTSELNDIFKALKSKKKYYKLKNNDIISLEDNDNIRELSGLIDDLEINDITGSAEIPKYRALYIDSLKHNYKSINTNNLFNDFITNFKKYNNTSIDFDEFDISTLRDYQKEGVKWLYTIYKCDFGGILADEMGLGKSIQTISFIKQVLREKNDAKIIIVVPTSLVYNWQKEFMKFAPDLKYVVVADNKSKRKEVFENKDNYNIFITSYGLVRNDNDEYESMNFEVCIIDEAQNIKNYQALMTREIKKIKSKCKIALTGTPLENNVTELWSIFDFIMPGYLNSVIKFREKYNIKDIDENGLKTLKNLNYQISPFILRRKKNDVITSLPDKIENNIYIDLPDNQKLLYLKVLEDTKKELDEMIRTEGFQKSRVKILQLLMKLRQICIDPSIIYENYSGSRAKIDELIKIVNENILNGHKILIFSSFKRVLDNVSKEFNKYGISYYMIDGSVKSKDRMNLVEAFNKNNTNCFLITLKSGGTGLNLTGADVVIHLDIWWNPQVEAQATDRAHRIGQTKTVNVIKLITKGTIEERIIELQEKKKVLSDNLIEGNTSNESLSTLSENDIKKLLSYNN